MLNRYDKVITRVSIDMMDDRTQNLIKLRQIDQNNASIKHKIKSNQHKMQKQLTRNQKIAAGFIKSTLQQKLKIYFRKMLARTTLKKIAYKLITGKRKRDLQSGFLQIKKRLMESQQLKLQTLSKTSSEIKILVNICKKIENKMKFMAFKMLKNQKQRCIFINIFARLAFQTLQRNIIRNQFYQFFNQLKLINLRYFQSLIYAENLTKIIKTKASQIKRQTYFKILDSILVRQNRIVSASRQSKQLQINGFTANRKQSLLELREKIKNIKNCLQQQKIAKNKVFQEKKKYNNSSKLQMQAAQKKFAKELKAQQQITNQIQAQCEDQERLIGIRNHIKSKSIDAQNRCDIIYKSLQRDEVDQVKVITKYLPNLASEIIEFQKSQIRFFKNNLKLYKLIDIHEKRDPYSYEAEYYQLQYENNVLRQTIGCFMNARYASLPKQEWKASVNEQLTLDSLPRNSL